MTPVRFLGLAFRWLVLESVFVLACFLYWVAILFGQAGVQNWLFGAREEPAWAIVTGVLLLAVPPAWIVIGWIRKAPGRTVTSPDALTSTAALVIASLLFASASQQFARHLYYDGGIG